MNKVKSITIKSFKCLQDFKAEPNNRNIMIIGKNGTGKSSLTQFIKIATGDDNHIPPNATGSGVVIMDREGKEYILKVKIRDGKSIVEVTTPEGSRDDKKNSLRELFGSTDFDINHFAELSNTKKGQKEQVEIYKKFLDKEVLAAIEKHESDKDMSFKDRAEVNKDMKELEVEVKNHKMAFMSEKALNAYKHTDVSALSAELKPLAEFNATRTPIITRIDERIIQLKGIEKEIDKLTKQAEGLHKQNVDAAKWLKENPEKDTKTIEEKISNSTKTNETYTQAQELIKKRKQLLEAENKSGELTCAIELKRQAISDAIKDMANPVEGLSFEGDLLMYQMPGKEAVPVSSDSMSTSELYELGMRLKLAENNEFGILFIDQMESIGNERMEIIIKLAKEHDCQIIGECVDKEDGPLRIEILNG